MERVTGSRFTKNFLLVHLVYSRTVTVLLVASQPQNPI